MLNGSVTSLSVIIPAWNARDTIGAAIRSALDQTGVNLQIIVIDDCSTDDTVAVVQAIASDRLELHSTGTNGGPAAARNIGLLAARGDYIAILDADDRFMQDRLSNLIADAQASNADIIADNLIIENAETGKIRTYLSETEIDESRVIDLAHYLDANHIFSQRKSLGYLKPVFRAAFLKQHNLRYDPALRIGEDYMLVARSLALGAKFVLHPRPGYIYTMGRSGTISNRLRRPQLDAMIAADHKFAAEFGERFSPEVRLAFEKRSCKMRRASDFLETVALIKQGAFGRAAAIMTRNPRIVANFYMPVRAKARQARAAFTKAIRSSN